MTPHASTLPTAKSIEFSQATFENLIVAGVVADVHDYLLACGGIEGLKMNDSTALLSAINCSQIEVFKYLVAQGLSVDDGSEDGYHFLYNEMLALDAGPIRDQFLMILYDYSKILFTKTFEPRLKRTATADQPEVFTNWRNEAIKAMAENDFLFIKWLVEERGARADCDFDAQGTFLHSAIINSCESCIKVLLQHGADVNAPLPRAVAIDGFPVKGFTPLMLAVRLGEYECAQELLKHPRLEVTKGLPDDEFMTPRALARSISDAELRTKFLRILKARPADAARLAKWIEDFELADVDFEWALKRSCPGMLEFLLHNLDDVDMKPEWLNHSEFGKILELEQ